MYQPETIEDLAALLALMRTNGVQTYQPGPGRAIVLTPNWSLPATPAERGNGMLESAELRALSTDELERLARRRSDEEDDLFPDG